MKRYILNINCLIYYYRYEQGLEDYDEENPINHKQTANYPVLKEPNFSPSHLLLTVLKTIVDVVRGVNKKRIESKTSKTVNQTSVHGNPAINGTEEIVHKIDLVNSLINETNTNTNSSSSVGRGYDDIGVISYVDDHSYHDYHHHDHHMESMAPPPPPPSTEPPKMEMMKQSRYSDPWEGYYDFIITEGSFKFWSGFQVLYTVYNKRGQSEK